VCDKFIVANWQGIDRDAVWDLDLGGPKEARIRWGAHWRHLANTTEPSMCGCDAALCQITLTSCSFSVHYFVCWMMMCGCDLWRSQRADSALYKAAHRQDADAQAGLESHTSSSETQIERNSVTHQGVYGIHRQPFAVFLVLLAHCTAANSVQTTTTTTRTTLDIRAHTFATPRVVPGQEQMHQTYL